ncbi:diaminopimelate epimerase [Neisseria sp. Ec49-e6-T10]|uniref:diaminopimelate epimerase n=1 Tax=Neisseria sp. Ec49-e6-T10 TaxID=3140744 RepID=UPI003EB7037B
MNKLKFTKMHGLGNDFMVINAIDQIFIPDIKQIQQWSDRHFGIGFDQLLLVQKPDDPTNDFKYRIFNADGNEVEQCGNGARCFMRFVYEKQLTNKSTILVETVKETITLSLDDHGLVTVNMGQPRFEPKQIPFLVDKIANKYTIEFEGHQAEITCINMGNPHAVLLVKDVEQAPVEQWGSAIEKHPLFPEGVNVGFLQILNKSEVKLRVFERGVGETFACGTGACAAVVAGIRLGLLNETVCVFTQKGQLTIHWQEQQPVTMTGPAQTVFEGEISY